MSWGNVETEASFRDSWVRFTNFIRPAGNLRQQHVHYIHFYYQQWCYDRQTFNATAVVGYHQTRTAIAVFYSFLGGLSGRCFLKTVPRYSAEQQ